MTGERLRLRRILVLRGANWAADGSVAVGVLEGPYDPADWERVRAAVARILPSGEPAGRLSEPRATAGAAVEAVAAALCAWAGHPPVARRRTAVADATGGRLAILPLWHEGLTLGALRLAAATVARAARGLPDDAWIDGARRRIDALRGEASLWLKGSRRWIVRAAEARGIAWRPVAAAPHLLLLGEGRHGRRFHATATWKTTHISGSIASDKRAANQMLRSAGVPAARQRVVADATALSAAAGELGLPLVVKPSDARLQAGVTFLYRVEDAERAFGEAAAHGSAVVAESFLPGREYRILVIDGAVVEAFERPPPLVVGDGAATIAELVARENAKPDRGPWRDGFPIGPITLDAQSAAFLAHEGKSVDHVPAAGEVVATHPMPMLRFGGHERVEVTGRIHPDNRALAIRALAILGLDVGGIDFRTPDITRSWREVGAGVCEVNPQPDLSAHYMPGLRGDVAGTLVDSVFPAGRRHRMRHVVLVGQADLAPHAAA
ncbi:MAG: hypothetical protein IT561_27890, partial [Alphaproteobacteria bacterium]|nr:hypothetical protein [Alphaproteobacteria bacterium]